MTLEYLTYDDTYWVFDIETDDLNATTIWCCGFINVETGEEYLAVGEDEVRKFVEEHPGCKWVGHNSISFDAPTIRRLIGCDLSSHNVIDTLVMSRLFDPKLEGGHSLDSWGKRLKMPKGDFKDFSKYSDEMGVYCLQDIRITRKLFRKLSARMKKEGFSNTSVYIEHNIREVTDGQRNNGFYFDIAGATELGETLRELASNLEQSILELFPPELKPVARYKFRLLKNGETNNHFKRHTERYPKIERDGDEYVCFDYVPFNIGSVPQRIEKLLSLGWKPRDYTDKGNPKVDEESLLEFAETSKIPEVTAIADWLVATGRANMIYNWLANVDKANSVMRGYVDSCGASTRRMTHSSPNTANIPGLEVKWGHECRSMWQARPKRLLCGADAKALEMRMFGHYLNNDEAARMYIEGDPHTFNADMLEIERRPMKSVFYAFLYGASDGKLGRTAGIKHMSPAKWGAQAREKLISRTPGLEALVGMVAEEQRRGLIKTLDGGFVRCDAPHSALNYKLQSGGAVAMKLVAIRAVEAIRQRGLDALLVGNIHDELQFDCAPDVAEEVGELILSCFLEAGKELGMRVPLEGDYKIGRNWAETH